MIVSFKVLWELLQEQWPLDSDGILRCWLCLRHHEVRLEKKIQCSDKTFLLRLRKKTLTEEQIATVICDTLKGLEYLHLRKKIHRDIKVIIIEISYFLSNWLWSDSFIYSTSARIMCSSSQSWLNYFRAITLLFQMRLVQWFVIISNIGEIKKSMEIPNKSSWSL